MQMLVMTNLMALFGNTWLHVVLVVSLHPLFYSLLTHSHFPADLDMVYDTHRGYTYRQRIEKDEKRFRFADVNKDNQLDREEFGSFLHPRK